MSAVRCGVIGVGYLGQHHARVYAELPGAELVGVCDTDRKRAEKVARKCRCDVFDSIEALAAQCEAISVVVPTDYHHAVTMPLLEADCHVLVEKPLCQSLGEAEEMLERARERELIIQVGHIEHYNPVMDYLEEHVSEARYLTSERLAPFNARGTEVGVVLDLMIHDIGLILKLVHSPVSRVDAVGVHVVSPTEDIANARIAFENGCVANLNVSRVSLKKIRKLRVFQPKTYLSMDFMGQEGYLMKLVGDKPDMSSIKREKVPIRKGEPLQLELASFVDCIRHRESPKVDAFLGRRALELAIEITDQIRQQGYTPHGSELG